MAIRDRTTRRQSDWPKAAWLERWTSTIPVAARRRQAVHRPRTGVNSVAPATLGDPSVAALCCFSLSRVLDAVSGGRTPGNGVIPLSEGRALPQFLVGDRIVEEQPDGANRTARPSRWPPSPSRSCAARARAGRGRAP